MKLTVIVMHSRARCVVILVSTASMLRTSFSVVILNITAKVVEPFFDKACIFVVRCRIFKLLEILNIAAKLYF